MRKVTYIAHSGTKGMKWGYNDGRRNGKRTASAVVATRYNTGAGTKLVEELKKSSLHGIGKRAIDSLIDKGVEAIKNSAAKGAKYFETHNPIPSTGTAGVMSVRKKQKQTIRR